MPKTTKTTVGFSSAINTSAAVNEAYENAISNINSKIEPDIAIVFATVLHEQNILLSELKAKLPDKTKLVGCSGEGTITKGGSYESTHALSIMLIESKVAEFEVIAQEGLHADSYKVGKYIANEVNNSTNHKRSKALILFPDGLTTNCTKLITALEENLTAKIPIFGGTAGDLFGHLDQTFQYCNDHVYSDACTALLISGDVEVDYSISHGCLPLGIDMEVTKVTNNFIEEIDHKKAWDVFKEYLPDNPSTLTGQDSNYLCFGQKLEETVSSVYPEYIIRTPLGHNIENGSIFIAAELAKGSKIRMVRRDPQKVTEDTFKTVQYLKEKELKSKGSPIATLQFDCAGRGIALFGSGKVLNESLIQPTFQILEETNSWMGFHTFGEIAPIHGKTQFHNYTVVILRIYES